MLTATGVTKRYGKITALNGVDLELPGGQVLAVIGPNGAGKSTLIKCLIGLVKFEGKVTVDGLDIAKAGRKARAKIGYLPQNPAFHPDLTVTETALFYADLKRVSATRAREGVDAVGLTEHAGKKVGQLSGGMRQRLALAMALLADPPLLILDEPVTGLDMAARLELRRLVLDQRAKGTAVMLSTHWLEDVPYIADRALILEQGKRSYFGPAQESAAISTPRNRLYLRLNGHTPDAIPLLETLTPGGVERSGDWLVVSCRATEKANVVEQLVTSGIRVLDFHVEEAASLKEDGQPGGGY